MVLRSSTENLPGAPIAHHAGDLVERAGLGSVSRVLLVGRVVDRLTALSDSLKALPYATYVAHSSATAFDLCHEYKFAAVLIDLSRMEQEGIDIADRIQSNGPSPHPLIVFLRSPAQRDGFSRPHAIGPLNFPDAGLPELIRFAIENPERALTESCEQRLERRIDELTKANDALRQFSWAASHDLAEPLRAILTRAEYLTTSSGIDLGDKARESIEVILNKATQMRHLMDTLRQYIHIGEFQPTDWKEVDCNTIVRGCLDRLESAIGESQAVILRDSLPTLRSSELLLTQIFQNLIANAIRYRSAAPPEIYIRCEKRNEECVFSISDNGVGIDPMFLEYIFAPFNRLSARGSSGAGLGLAICRTAVGRLGGRIWAESDGHGSTFCFVLPDRR
jgi:signal transduction histidine kinase